MKDPLDSLSSTVAAAEAKALPGFPNEWGIAVAAGRVFVGRAVPVPVTPEAPSGVALSPVYELRWVDLPTQGPGGQVVLQTNRQLGAALGFDSWTAMALPSQGLIWQPLLNLSGPEVEGLRGQILGFEQARAQAAARAHASRLADEMKAAKGFGGGAR